jgi:hypothetical protein
LNPHPPIVDKLIPKCDDKRTDGIKAQDDPRAEILISVWHVLNEVGETYDDTPGERHAKYEEENV